MFLERLQVEEGFLSGLDVNLTAGLNVVIGARGTGKTSLIELIRYCLDAHGNAHESTKKSRDHALSILGSGQVTVTLSNAGQKIIITRTASDQAPRSSGSFLKPIVFSQTEIETIGLESSGRLRLIDGFIPAQISDDTEEKQSIAAIASLTAEAVNIKREIDDLEETLKSAATLDVELTEIMFQEAAVASTSNTLKQKTVQLQKLSESISLTSVQEINTIRTQNAIYSWYDKIKNALEHDLQSDEIVAEGLLGYLPDINSTTDSLRNAHDLIAKIWHSLELEKKKHLSIKLNDEAKARESRQELESMQAGAGQIMRQGHELREKIARLESLSHVYTNKKGTLANLILRRSSEFEKLENIRSSRFYEREKIIQKLNASLGPNIRIAIKRNGQQSRFASLIADMLRGSGVKYGEISPLLASSVSPRALLEAVENFDISLISLSSGIGSDRAARILTHLRSCDLGFMGTIDLEDEISMHLLDGSDYKDISALSTGQRCTVILPIVLAHQKRIVIVDQPEDHIDNAFITSTLIRAVLARDPLGQIIFSTHNPNIPVLGSADNVIHLASDGKRGYVIAKGSLNEEPIVNSISTVMEGGVEAFMKRSDFYNQSFYE